MRTCISPKGFSFGIHKPSYTVRNLRDRTQITSLGTDPDGTPVMNNVNYPVGNLDVESADWIYEVANPFPFRGTTFIGKKWADHNACDPSRIGLAPKPDLSLTETLDRLNISPDLIDQLPRPVLLSIATMSTNPDELVRLAHLCCTFKTIDPSERLEMHYKTQGDNRYRPDIVDHDLFDAVANNPALPDNYKIAMVIRPGAQGASEIVGDFHAGSTHVYEYLRRNSYIGGGHYAANMADDAIRYDIGRLERADMQGLRQLYYQRSYVRLADALDIHYHAASLDKNGLESLRCQIIAHPGLGALPFSATLWGWNFGFDFSSTGYRLHASHQQIHQQYSLIPTEISYYINGEQLQESPPDPFSAGDMISEAIDEYRTCHSTPLFEDYLKALHSNRRMDNRDDLEASLVIWEDDCVMLFVPKAQVSQWELQIMTKPLGDGSWPGNILETDLPTRSALDTALLKGQKALSGLGARMVTSIELSKRFQAHEAQQPLIYSLMPKIPNSPGALSETQSRFINGHYPEDFAAACRLSLPDC